MQPQITKWTLLLLGVLLLCLVGWWFLSPSDTPKPDQATPDATQFPSQYTVSTTGGGTQTSPSASYTDSVTSPDVAAAFATLFSKVGAVGVSATSVDSASSGDSAAVYALYAKKVAISKEMYPKESAYPIHVAFIDLNEDGVDEALVYGDLPGFCGIIGCPFDIYQKKAGTWNNIFSTVVQGEVGLLNVYINTYRSLLLTLSSRHSGSEAVTYGWDGKMYKAGTVVATWGGTGFVLKP